MASSVPSTDFGLAASSGVLGDVTQVSLLQCNAERCKDMASTVQFVKQYRTQIDASVVKNGAVLFRGFPMKTPEDFDKFVCAFDGFEDLSYEKSMSFAVRKRLCNRICTTNEGKSGGLVFHHEQAQTPLWPSKVFFCCQKAAAPGDGGGTGLTNSSMLLQQLRQKYPDFVAKCEREGVHYTIYSGPEQDTSKGSGRSWKSFFGAKDRDECEQKMRDTGFTWTWGEGPHGRQMGPDFLKCTTPLLDAVKTAPGTEKRCFFNQLIATIANALEMSQVGVDGGGFDPKKSVPTQADIDACVRFGSGDSIPLEVLLNGKDMCEANALDVQWQDGDVVFLDNYIMMHARRWWDGPQGSRLLLASLTAETDCSLQLRRSRL